MSRLIDADALPVYRVKILHAFGIIEGNVIFPEDVKKCPTIDAEPVITGDTSDGYHTFNELYHHRAVLFSVIIKAFPDKAWKSRKHHDGTMYDDMFIVGIETPEGQATYHYDIDPYWEMFQCKEVEFAPEWDGHTPEQAIERIRKLEPVRHGRWIKEKLVMCEPYYTCSECGKLHHQDYNFCNNCGAKMDAEGINVPTNEPNKICPINGAPCNECVPGAYCAKMDGEEHEYEG